ncbi:MAG: tetratricopeptide repeat protein [Desulfuromusa sp.]|nr:tetratricopeptide repeat protein [Desulfuromusa sp.]
MLKLLTMIMILALVSCVPVVPKEQRSDLYRANAHYKLALGYLAANNPTAALKELLISVKLAPESDVIQVALAQTYQRKKAYSLAEIHYLKALELSDNDPRYQNNLASLYLDMEEWDKALYYFDQAAHNLLFVNSTVSISGKGYTYLKKKDYPAALAYLNEAIELDPRYASPYFFKSEVYRALGNLQKERILLQRTIALEPKFLEPRYRLAVVLLQEGRTAEAIEHLKTLIDLSPQTAMGFKAEDLLKSLSKW